MGSASVVSPRLGKRLRDYVPLLVLAFVLLRLTNAITFAWLAVARGERWDFFLFSWDSQWLLRAARLGWPSIDLTEALDDQVSSTWAWPPLAPLLARLSGLLLGDAAIGPSLIALNVAGGAIAAVVLFKMVSEFWNEKAGFVAALAWMAMPASPVFVMGYAEGVFAAFAFSALWALQRRHYLLASALLVPAGLTKLQVVPFALAVLAVVIFRWWRSGFTQPGFLSLVGSMFLSLMSMFAWPVVVAVRLGTWDAYSQVRSTWNHETIPFLNTINWVEWLVTIPNQANAFAGLALVLAVVAAIWAVRSKEIPAGIKWTGATMPVFLAFAGAGVSTVRYLLPDLVIALFVSRFVQRKWHFISLGVLLMASQVVWIATFVVADPGSTPP